MDELNANNSAHLPSLGRQTRLNQQAQMLAVKERAALSELFSSSLGQRVLCMLELQFETHLPAFQGRLGQFDALDAMRRDAYREVFLRIRQQMELAKEEITNKTTIQ